MDTPMKSRLRSGSVVAMLAAALTLTVSSVSSASTGDAHALIEGSGSSWAANAVNQWVADVASQGIQVVYTPDGDAQGRQDFATKTSDFAVTAIGYQGVDPVTGVSDTSQGRDYAYLPIAAGGTAFPYHIVTDGKQVRNLRLSGETLTKIFTNKITNWDNAEITKDNNGHALPSLPIVPVVQSEGSGATAQLTKYFTTEYPSIWNPFAGGAGMTEYFPRQGQQIAQDGSNSAMNYVASSEANGSIGYVEYSFALSVNYPVVQMLNAAGYYTLPTQYNVAVALEDAVINMDKSSPNYLLQNLDHVYTDPDPRTYPLSSYVYMIEPTGVYPNPEPNITPAKRQSISDFAYYAICQGQREIGPIGYSPLPVNLVEAGFGQIAKLKQADPSLDLTERNIATCNNPTFVEGHPSKNYLAEIAPQPLSCDKAGLGPCANTVVPTGTGGSTTGPAGSGTKKGSGSTTGPGSGSTTGSGGSTTTTTTTTTTTVPPPPPTVNKQTGQVAAGVGPGAKSFPASIQNATLTDYKESATNVGLSVFVVVVILSLMAVPAVIGLRRARRRRANS
jgi:phosphate transport system substrate-binding protein